MVQIILQLADIIFPRTKKINEGQSSELCANLISCASGELNKDVDGSGAEGDGRCESKQPPSLGGGGYNLEGGADGRPTMSRCNQFSMRVHHESV